MFDAFFSKYIVYTKVFQWFSFSTFMSSFLRKFTDKAPYIQSDIDFESLNELSNIALKNNAKLTFSTTPMNSGTLALVFKGKLIENSEEKDVVIKTLRCGIRAKIHSAIDNLEFLFNILRYIPYINKFNFLGLLGDIRKELLYQVDFVHEKDNIKYAHKITKMYKKMDQPNVVEYLCTNNCITMDFIKGSNILTLSKDVKESFVEPMVMTFVYFTFKKQMFHLDSHAGNVLFNPEKMTISFLDLGMMMKLEPQECDFLAELILAIHNDFEENEVIDMFLKFDTVISKKPDNMKSTLEQIFKKYPKLFESKLITDLSKDVGILLYEIDTTSNELKPTVHKLLLGFISFLSVCEIMDGGQMLFRSVFIKVMNDIKK